MDCGCNCLGIAASSRKPVKRYNLLMPALFGSKPPPASGELDASEHRRIKKVVEYCEKNPHRLPKVWRNMQRSPACMHVPPVLPAADVFPRAHAPVSECPHPLPRRLIAKRSGALVTCVRLGTTRRS